MSSPTFRVDLNVVSKKCAEYYSFFREPKSKRPFDGVACISKSHAHTLVRRLWQLWLYMLVSQTKIHNAKVKIFRTFLYYIFCVFNPERHKNYTAQSQCLMKLKDEAQNNQKVRRTAICYLPKTKFLYTH